MARVGTFVGSITDAGLGAHAIVNASNPDVVLGSGVSGAIRAACGGPPYQDEVSARFDEEFGEPLTADECLVTGPGASDAFRWVLHVPSVDYRTPDPETGRPSGPTRIRSCTAALLAEATRLAEEHGLTGQMVVGVPLLGASHGLQGEVASADCMMEAIAKSGGDTIAEVRFAVLSEPDARLIVDCADKHGLQVTPG